MRLVSYEAAGAGGIGVLAGDDVLPTVRRDLLEVIDAGGVSRRCQAPTR